MIPKSTGFVCHHALCYWSLVFWGYKLSVNELAKDDDFHVLPQHVLWEQRDAKTSASDSETSFHIVVPNHTPSKTAHDNAKFAHFPLRCFYYWVCCMLNSFENQYHISILKYQTTIFVASGEQKVFSIKLAVRSSPSVCSVLCSGRECGTRIFLCQVYCYRGIPFVGSYTSFAIRMHCCSNIHVHEMKSCIGYLCTL